MAAAEQIVAALQWSPAKRHLCVKHCPAAKAYVVVSRPRADRPNGRTGLWPITFYLDRQWAGTLYAASPSAAIDVGDRWIVDQLIARHRNQEQ